MNYTPLRLLLLLMSMGFSTSMSFSQSKRYNELHINQNLVNGQTAYERTDKKGVFESTPFLYVKKDGKIVIRSEGNLFRYSFNPTKVEITINKPFGDSLLGPFSIKGLPGLSLPGGIDGTAKKMRIDAQKGVDRDQKELQKREVDRAIEAKLNTIKSLQGRLVNKSEEYEKQRSAYKEQYRNLRTNLFERKKYLDEIKITANDPAVLRSNGQQVYEGFFRPFSATPSISLASLLSDYAETEVNKLKKVVEGTGPQDTGGLTGKYNEIKDFISTIKVLANSLVEEHADELKEGDKTKLKKIVASAQEALSDLEKAHTEVLKLHETVKTTDWALDFTKFWQAKEDVINANFVRYYTQQASGDKIVIRQSYKVMSFVDGKLIAGPPTIDTAFTVRVKGNLHINVSVGLGFPFRTEDKFIVKPDSPTSATTGTIVQTKGGIGSPYLVSMLDVSWSNYSNVTPIISAGVGYPLAGGSLAGFAGGGVAFEVAGRRVLFHAGLAYVKSNVLGGGYKLKDGIGDEKVAKDFIVPVENGYRFKPFFAFTYNLSQVK